MIDGILILSGGILCLRQCKSCCMRLGCLYRNNLDEKTIVADDVQIVKRRSENYQMMRCELADDEIENLKIILPSSPYDLYTSHLTNKSVPKGSKPNHFSTKSGRNQTSLAIAFWILFRASYLRLGTRAEEATHLTLSHPCLKRMGFEPCSYVASSCHMKEHRALVCLVSASC
jgi:hypothetical protein